ncbi:hypothetical protein [Streptomyces sp. NPDC059130]|uniref:hypothetical protein n=1 Tax=unclassified Streptomyces TaxID=2593676 RepID=UPI0036A45B45
MADYVERSPTQLTNREDITSSLAERHEDIDVGLTWLAASLARHQGAAPDTLQADLTPPAGGSDDTALVVLRL